MWTSSKALGVTEQIDNVCFCFSVSMLIIIKIITIETKLYSKAAFMY